MNKINEPNPVDGLLSGTVGERVRTTVDRLKLNEHQASRYLGVSVHTYRKWKTGEREPNAVVTRLLDLLNMLEMINPVIHASLIPDQD